MFVFIFKLFGDSKVNTLLHRPPNISISPMISFKLFNESFGAAFLVPVGNNVEERDAANDTSNEK